MKSEFRTGVYVCVIPKGKFELTKPLVYCSKIYGSAITVPIGFPTDFASIPWLLRSIIKVNGRHRPAAVVHDFLCEHGLGIGVDQKAADRIFLEAMTVLDVRFTQRRIMYRGVRTFQMIKGWFR